MNTAKLLFFSSVILAAAALPARAEIVIQVDQSTQRMSVDVDGEHLYDWRVSTGRPSLPTPNGNFHPNRMDADHYSKEYDNAPMPNAIFFDLHGDAIHGSYDPVGHPAASHGCVRLDPDNAATLFDLVNEEGMANTRIEISGDVNVAMRNSKPASKQRVARRLPPPGYNGYSQGQPEPYGRTYDYGSRYYAAPQEQYPAYNSPTYGYGASRAPQAWPW
jgi:hypothetical protein